MVTEKTIHCAVVRVPAETSRMPRQDPSRFRPSDLVPWADPYIASLVRKLQREVREERQGTPQRAADQALNVWDPWDWQGEEGQAVLERSGRNSLS